jgi:DNA gyrase subunit A
MIINRSGIIIRLKVSNLRVMGRATQGVRLINLNNDDIIAAVTQVPTDLEPEEEIIIQENENNTEEINNEK